jgi:hypothetical protein
MSKLVSREEQRKLYRAWKTKLQHTKLSKSEIIRRAKTFAKKGMQT